MGTPEPPYWIRVYAADVEAGDLVRFTELGDAVRLLDREQPPAWSRTFRVRLDGDTTTALAKSTRIWVFDADGSVTRRARVTVPEDRL